ncbi:bifunctional 3,4-dihydroxy-2-butanone-4-phosphate synthase/GTP cyclohydrolase II [Saccharospirillum salsuginis]|uniref:3,4-dihydroxy-2-butanone 4-phosphate synthase n=1 Tax=Saccharospirillum salsuginis TaxID=418750 RepID=A0A918N9E9_9GAMM|nr:bifunctional 3,4-dihydroxy-2-butanone-4-phosphate synthase/GTP cyclohydrolase II [Saccharospirillum salsuginis]GGX56133.1 3,4-dihydroxy-2-butanone 4-phosphate synthase [Saccharospirillum salsuginis]
MALDSIEDIIEDIRQGKPVVLMDDEDRENEGDLIVAAEKITPEIVNFMASKARGLICLTLTGERCDYLGLESMVKKDNGSAFGTPFTVSIEAAEGVTTGISAADRARTIRVAVDPDSKPEDIVQPGHIFPLRAQPGGVLSRAGHTEAGCDLARMAGMIPAAAIVEIMKEDGTMARRPDLEVFAKEHGLRIGTIADLIHYRILNERTIERIDHRPLNTQAGEFDVHVYRDSLVGGTHMALTLGGPFKPDEPTLVRVHVAQTLRDLLGVHPPKGHGWTLAAAMQRVAKEGAGVVVLLDVQQAPDVMTEMALYHSDERGRKRNPNVDKYGTYTTIGTGSQILRELGIGQMRLMSSPIKFGGISGFDLEVTEYINAESD